jgi:hypothetical protein
MIFDDVQSRDNADSQTQADKLEREIIGTAMKAKSPHGCLYIFVGNMYPTNFSILRKLKQNPTWIKFICGGILADGTSLWEELQPIKQLLAEYQNDLSMGHPEIFFSEVLNDENTQVNTHVDLTKIPKFEYPDDEVDAGTFILIDPATDKPGADAISIGLFNIVDGRPALWEIQEGSFSPGDTIRKTLQLCAKYGCSLVAIESNAYQYSLCYWFNFICQQHGITGIEVVPIYSGSYSKNSRIMSMFKELLAADVLVRNECRPLVWNQIRSFNALKRDNTDGLLDLLTYANKVVAEFGHFIVVNSVMESQEFDGTEVLGIEETSCF